jgi:hypothetical protein
MDISRDTRVGAIEGVQPGMVVTDGAGRLIGTVELLRMGDTATDTARVEEHPSAAGLVGQVFDAFVLSEPDVPEPLRSRLVRAGYLKIDGPGLFGTDRYVRADQIDAVEGDTVRLAVSASQLPVEE